MTTKIILLPFVYKGYRPDQRFQILENQGGSMKTLPAAFAALVALGFGTGCTTKIAARLPLSDSRISEVNELLEGHEATIEFVKEPSRAIGVEQTAGRERPRAVQAVLQPRESENRGAPAPRPLSYQEVRLGNDTTQWFELRPGDREVDEARWVPNGAPTAALKSVSVRRHGRGALEGLGIGFLTGALVGIPIGAAVSDSLSVENCHNGSCRLFGAIVFGAVGAAAGSLIGLFIGAGVGHKTSVDFDSTDLQRR
jgi:hypothetical protein